MINVREIILKNKLVRKHKLPEDSPIFLMIENDIKDKNVDFSKNTFKHFDGRLITEYVDLSAENVILLYLKTRLKAIFQVMFSNRNKLMEALFDKLRSVQNLRDLTIIRFDLKKYFYSISTQYVYEKYILNSKIPREDRDLFEDIIKHNKYCVAGLPIFNYMVELISRDLDKAIKARIRKYGVVYYARYVDDGVIILSNYVSKTDVKKVLDEAIEEVFRNRDSDNKVALNKTKFRVFNRRHLKTNQSFDFLGYQFSFNNKFSNIKVGMTPQKRDKYQAKVNKLIKTSYKKGDALAEETVRHIIKVHSSRVVYFAPSMKHGGVWVSKGLIANYIKLKDYSNYIDSDTKKFLHDIYKVAFAKIGEAPPAYLSNPRYDLYENLVANRTMIFNRMIGASREHLLKQLDKLDIPVRPDKDYDYLVKDYLISTKSGY